MVEKEEEGLSIVQQCILLSIYRSGIYCQRVSENELDLKIMLEIDKYYTWHPYYGTRRMSDYLKEATDVTYIPMPKGHMYLFKEVSLLLPNLLMFSKKTKLRSAWMVEGEHWIISS